MTAFLIIVGTYAALDAASSLFYLATGQTYTRTPWGFVSSAVVSGVIAGFAFALYFGGR